MSTKRSTIERRERNYPNTDFFSYYNANPKNNYCSDCVARAISVATNQSWEDVIRDMTEYGIKKGLVFNDKKCIKSYLKAKGWVKHKEPRDWDNMKMTAKDYLRNNYITTAIANLGTHHVAAIIDGQVVDTWDSSRQTMHTYWTPPAPDVIVLRRG